METQTAPKSKKGWMIVSLILILLLIGGTVFGLISGNNYREQIRELSEENEEQAENNSILRSKNSEKSAQIKSLTADVEEKDSQIEGLNADVDAKTNEIESLTGQIDTLTADVEEKNTQIESLTGELEEKSGQIDSLTAANEEKNAQIASLTEENENQSNQIDSLNDQLSSAGTTANDAAALAAVSEAQFSNAKRFILALQNKSMYYTYMTDYSDADEDWISVPLTNDSADGLEFDYDMYAIFTSDNSRGTLLVWNLIDFDPAYVDAVRTVCDSLNYEYRWIRFYVDTYDYSVSADISCPLTDSPDTAIQMWDATLHLYNVLALAYDDLAPYAK